MLRWQPPFIPDRTRFFAKVCVCSLGIHILAAILLFFVYQSSIFHVRLDTLVMQQHTVDVPVVFVPLCKQVTLDKKTVAARTKTKKAKTTQSKQHQKKATSIETQKKESQKRAAKKKASPKTKTPAQPKKETKSVAKKKPETKHQDLEMSETTTLQPVEKILLGQQEMDSLALQREVHSVLQKVWRCPPGVAVDVSCTLAILIDWNGSAARVHVEKPSGMPAFDTAVKRAARTAQYPRSVWGKEISVPFRSASA